jgi:hypothetical protein
VSNINDEYKRIRGYLNPTIRGPNVTAIIEALAPASLHLVDNVIAMNDSLYITTASDAYLDDRMSDFGIVRPETIGLSDEIFRQLGIEVINRKQVRDLIMRILEVVYGVEYTRATSNAAFLEPYSLNDGDNLIISYDDQTPITVIFNSSQFTNINFATAQEISDVITRATRTQGRTGSAFSKDDGIGSYVVLMPDTSGPSSSVKVLGGSAQNKLNFSQARATSALSSTQWTIQNLSGISRMIWSGGASPSLGKARKGDYANIYGSGFNPSNKGSFTITNVKSGSVNNAYIEFENQIVVAETVVQGSNDGFLVFNPLKITPTSKKSYALAFQTSSKVLEVYMPAVTKVIRRDRIGSAHLQESGPSLGTDYGPYIFDISKPYSIGGEECNTSQIVDSNVGLIINVDDSSTIADKAGHLVFDFAGNKEELVPYLGRPSSNSLMINPTYKFKNVHEVGTNISLVAQNYSPTPDSSGKDYQFFVTGITDGRAYVQDLINSVAATGMIVNIIILYPSDEGLGKAGTIYSEKTKIWG